MTEYKDNKVNDINLKDWKNEKYQDILTDSLWVINERDRSGVHNASYHGNFIPQIPNQLIRRYTKVGDWVLDPFMGSGTTLIEAKKLGRKAIGIELVKSVADKAIELIREQKQDNEDYPMHICVKNGDSLQIDYPEMIKDVLWWNEKISLAILHPPYFDIIKFSEDARCLSNCESINSFIAKMVRLTHAILDVLKVNGYLALVISDIYKEGEWIPLAFKVMNALLSDELKLKSIVVKNFNRTKAKANQENLWRYRALAGGFYVFKHEYIIIFQKVR